MMYAIIETGGKQYRVAQGQLLTIEKLEADAGSTIDFDRVLMIGEGEQIKFGAPLLTGAKVVAEVVKHGRADKIRIIKFRRRKHHMKSAGHRQYYTQVKITAIQ
ncbi:MAG: 50S ribosomal protein L21 [Gammaproteobacteria bacterium]|nr:50S ribosomal protein L21 [Gammaproteobacteria bacterium]